MKKGFRLMESTLWILGKGFCTKLLCDYSGTFYIFSLTITGIIHTSLIKTHSLSLPPYEFNFELFGKKIIATAQKQHNEISVWYENYKAEKREKAEQAKNKLEQVGMLDTAKEYEDGRIYL